METVCPVCNGLKELDLNCPECRAKVDDDGSLDNFLGPYSPYEEHDILHMRNDDQSIEECIHLVHCPECGTDYRVGVERLWL